MNKKLIAILTLVMFAVTLLPMGAFAASKNYTTGPVNLITATGTGQTAANIVIEDENTENLTSGGILILTLPSGVKWNSAVAVTATGAVTVGTIDGKGTSTLTIPITNDSASGDNIKVQGLIDVDTLGTGDIAVRIEQMGTGVSIDQDLVIARFISGNVEVKTMGTTVVPAEVSTTIKDIRITENADNVITSGSTIKLGLPQGFKWTASGSVAYVAGSSMTGTPAISSNGKDLTIKFTGTPADRQIMDLRNAAIRSEEKASYGEIIVTVSDSNNKVTTSEIVIGTYADYGIAVTAEAAKTIVSGTNNKDAAKVTIKENVPGSLMPKRYVKVELPSGVKFASGSTPALTHKSGTDMQPSVLTALGKPESKVEFVLNNAAFSTSASKLELSGIKLVTSGDFEGEVLAKITGSAGVEAEVLIAEVVKPIKIEVEKTDLVIGRQAQALGEITITETAKARIKEGKLELTLPANSNATWDTAPKAEVVEGDISIKKVEKNGDKIEITIDSESYKPSTIKLTGAKITTNRTIAEGDLKVSVKGAAIISTESEVEFEKAIYSVKIATVVTPAEDGVVKPVTMTVGSIVYTIDGVENDMDVAPYIKNDRTYFPVRYVANALGINDENVVWDPAQRTVTIFRANRIVQVSIGSTTMLVNGVPVTMDAAPEITAERTMLPIRFVAQGLGVNVVWDAATQTVTLN